MHKSSNLWSVCIILISVIFGLKFSYAQTPQEPTASEEKKAPEATTEAKTEATTETKTEATTEAKTEASSKETPESQEGLLDFKDPFVSALPAKPVEIGSGGPSQGGPSEEEKFDYSALNVTGLVWGIDNPKAIINGEVVGIGDVVNEAEIMNITADGILFKYKDKEYLMRRQGTGLQKKDEGASSPPAGGNVVSQGTRPAPQTRNTQKVL